MTKSVDLHKKLTLRHKALERERQLFVPHWREIQQFILPDRGRGLNGKPDEEEDRDGDKKRQKIYDSTGSRAIRVGASGLHAGLSSAASAWFKLSSGDPSLDKRMKVREYLWQAEERMRAVFARSNVYRGLHHTYYELFGFGTGALGQFESIENGIKFRPYTAGEYYIAQDSDGRVNSFYREVWMSAAQMVQEFGKENLSHAVQQALTSNQPDRRFAVLHAIEPNDGSIPIQGPQWAYRSVYLEPAITDGSFLRVKGYRRFPIRVPRWLVVGNQTYGVGVGQEILPDVKQLQKETEKKLIALDKMIDPPTVSGGEHTEMEINSIPGGHTHDTSAMPGRDGIRPLYEVRLDIGAVTADIQDLRAQIRQGAYNDLFMALIDRGSGQPLTAREVAERHEEKLAQIGPVLENLFEELLKPLVNDSYEDLADLGMFGDAPEELQGTDLQIQFISPLAVAQRMLGLGAVEQFSGFAAQAIALAPEIKDKVDFDRIIETYNDLSGAPPDFLVDDEEVLAIRARRAEQVAAEQATAQGVDMAKAAKMLGETDTGGNTVLAQTLNALPGGTNTLAGS